jgi:hypothetical protein
MKAKYILCKIEIEFSNIIYINSGPKCNNSVSLSNFYNEILSYKEM